MKKFNFLIFCFAVLFLASHVMGIPPSSDGEEYEQALEASQQFHEQAELATTVGMIFGVLIGGSGGIVYHFKKEKKRVSLILVVGGGIIFAVMLAANILSKLAAF